jgi:hypothetical protein
MALQTCAMIAAQSSRKVGELRIIDKITIVIIQMNKKRRKQKQ